MNRFKKNIYSTPFLFAFLLHILLIYSIFIVGVEAAFSCTSNGTGGGAFNVAATWTNCNGTIPQITDTIIINNGDTVTLVATTTIAGVTINNGGILDANTRVLIDTGSYTNNGSQTGTTSTMTLSGVAGTLIDGTGTYAPTGIVTISTGGKTLTAGSKLTFDKITVTGVTLTNNSTAGLSVSTALSGTGGFTQGSNAVLKIGTTSAITTLTATASGNNVIYNGSGNQTVKGTTYENLTINKSAGTGTLGAATIIQSTGALVIAAGTLNLSTLDITNNAITSITGTLNDNNATGTNIFVGKITVNPGGAWSTTIASNYTLRGGITNNGSVTLTGTGVFTFDTNSQTIDGSNPISLKNVTVTGVTLTNSSPSTAGFSVMTALAGSGELKQDTNAFLKLGVATGSFTITTFTATATGNQVAYNGTAAQTLRGTTYETLVINATVGVIVSNSDAATIIQSTGSLTVTTGTLNLNSKNFTNNSTTSLTSTLDDDNSSGNNTFVGLITINAGGIWTSTGNANYVMRGGVSFSGTTFASGSGIYTFDTNAQNIVGPNAFTIQNVTVSAITLTNLNTAGFTVNTDLTGSGTLTQGTNAILKIGGTSGITTLTAIAAGNTVQYISTTASQTVAATTYVNLTIVKTAQIAMLAGLTTVNGNLIVTSGTLADGGFTMIVKGNSTMTGTHTGSGKILFSGGGSAHVIAGAGSYNNVELDDTNGVTQSAITNITGTLTVTSGTWTASNTIAISSNASITGTFAITSTTGTKTFNNITINTGGTMSFSAAELVAMNGNLVVNGTGSITGTSGIWTFQKVGGGTISGTASGFTMTSDTFTTNYVLSIPATITTVTVTGAAVSLTNNIILTVNGTLGGTGQLIQGASSVLNLGGTTSITTLDASVNSNEVHYTSTIANQGIKVANYYHLFIDKAGRIATAATGVTNVLGNLTVTAGSIALASSVLTVTGTTDIHGTLSDTNNTGRANFGGLVTVYAGGGWDGIVAEACDFNFSNGFVFNGSSFVRGGGMYTFLNNNQSISGSGAVNITKLVVTGIQLNNSNTLTVGVTNSLSGTGTFTGATGSTLTLSGTNTISTFDATASGNTVNYNGAAAQTVKSGVYSTLDISGNTNTNVNIIGDTTANTLLTLGATKFATSSNKVIISPGATLSRTTGYIDGNLQKNIPTGASSTSFEVGSGSNYAPANIAFGNVTGAGNLTVTTITGEYPNVSTSGFTINTTLNRYWTATNSGITFTNYSAAFNFVAGDLDPMANTTNFILKKFDTGTWTTPTLGTVTPTSVQGTGMTGFSDFVISDLPVSNVTSSLANSTYPIGQVVPIQITFVDNAFVTGTPQLALNSGGSAYYTSGSGTNTLTFNYTVAPGENASDLDYTSTSALILNAGAIQDLTTANLDLTLPNPGAAGSLGFNKNIVLDAIAPSFTGVNPIIGSLINSVTTSSDVVYTLSKNIASGTITVTRTGGAADGGSPHTCNLAGTALTAGAHTIDFSDTANGCNPAITLVNEAIYTFVFDAVDTAGNASTTVTSTNIAFGNVTIILTTSPTGVITQTAVITLTKRVIANSQVVTPTSNNNLQTSSLVSAIPALFDVITEPLPPSIGTIFPAINIGIIGGSLLALGLIIADRRRVKERDERIILSLKKVSAKVIKTRPSVKYKHKKKII